MAKFNPDINPINSPGYGRDSRVIDVPNNIQPEGVRSNQILPEGVRVADRSAEYKGSAAAAGMQSEAAGNSGIADIFSSVVGIGDFLGKVGDNLIKKDLENKVYEIANKEREEYTNRLQSIKSAEGVRTIMDSNASADEPKPSELEDLPNTLSTLQGAKNSGKISSTYYYGRLLSEAKDLRTKYPTYKEYIDQQFAKVTGVNPANAYVTALTSDLNRAASSANSEKNKVLTFIQGRLGYPGSEEVMRGFLEGRVDAMTVYKWAAPYEQQESTLKRRALLRADTEGSKKEDVESAKDDAQLLVSATVRNTIDNVLIKTGLDTPEKVQSLMAKVASGAISTEQIRQIGESLAQVKTQLTSDLNRNFDTVDAGGKSLAVRVGGKKAANDIITENTKEFDMFIESIYNKDFGKALSVANAIKAKVDDTQKNLLNDQMVGPFFTQVQAMGNIAGDQWLKDFFMEGLKRGIQDKYKNYFDRYTAEVFSQANSTNTGKPLTYNDIFEDMRKKKVYDTKVVKGILGTFDKITDAGTPDAIKVNIAASAFSPGNRGFLNKIADKDQQSLFLKMTSPEVSGEIARLSKADPRILANYKDWVNETFAVNLFSRELADLNKVVNDGRFNTYWDTENKRFRVEVDPSYPGIVQSQGRGNETSGIVDAQYENVKRTINRINFGLYNVKNVANATGDDVEAYLLRTLIDSGFTPGNRMTGFSQSLTDALARAKLSEGMKNAGGK